MKAIRILFGFGLLVTFGILSCSCTKVSSNGETIVPIGKEYFNVEELFSEVKPTFDEVREIMGIGDEDLIPPKVVGEYVVNPTVLVASSEENMPTDMSDVHLSFDCQHNSIATIKFTESSITQVTDPVYIVGNSNSFTAYFIENTEYLTPPYNGQVFHVKRRRGIIMCGSATPEGLSNFRYASIIIEMKDDSQGVLPQYASGTYMIYKDGNGLAEKL